MLNKTRISNTNIYVSKLGLGTVKFGRNQQVKYPSAFQLPSDKQVQELLDLAWNKGVNLIDTAPAYGASEERLGKLINKSQDWVISTKVGEIFNNGKSSFDFSKKHIINSVCNSLKTLKRDYLDIVLVHSDGNDLEIIASGVFEHLSDLKAKGDIRAYGMSTKTVPGAMKTIEESDIAMIALNANYLDEIPVIEEASRNNKGIFIKKALDSGHLSNQDGKSESPLLIHKKTKGISSVIIGTINTKHLNSNINELT